MIDDPRQPLGSDGRRMILGLVERSDSSSCVLSLQRDVFAFVVLITLVLIFRPGTDQRAMLQRGALDHEWHSAEQEKMMVAIGVLADGAADPAVPRRHARSGVGAHSQCLRCSRDAGWALTSWSRCCRPARLGLWRYAVAPPPGHCSPPALQPALPFWVLLPALA